MQPVGNSLTLDTVESPASELVEVRHRLDVLVDTRLLADWTADERAEFDRLTDRESALLMLVGDNPGTTTGR